MEEWNSSSKGQRLTTRLRNAVPVGYGLYNLSFGRSLVSKLFTGYESCFKEGGFSYLAAYNDLMTDERANKEAYDFWAEKTRARIDDPRKKDLLAPLTPPHPLSAKRPSLEQYYYEIFNLPNVDLVDVSDGASPIIELTKTGVRTKEGVEELDVIVLATGSVVFLFLALWPLEPLPDMTLSLEG